MTLPLVATMEGIVMFVSIRNLLSNGPRRANGIRFVWAGSMPRLNRLVTPQLNGDVFSFGTDSLLAVTISPL